ncbi:myelin basic protein-like isoform X2 [Boleophthalmus pectinirostris]|uniref:myelin basic protein-like isoform X2 n=1 Tax=Boleophthalmus pectinirostris TaxID=150288 RepID=UPI002431CE83|nr:myelin basic protein-like isoform X2 [Boleophthalmus pectinirostris]
MASASSKKNPGVLDHIGKIFGGDKKKKSKGSFRGALSPAPQKAAASQKKKGADSAVVTFLRSIVSPAPPKSRKSQPKAKKAAAGDGKGTLTRMFKMGSRSASPSKR